MVAFATETARAKVNLALHVLGRRPDGYHELDSIVVFADFGDSLTFEPADNFGIAVSGPFAGDLSPSTDNIIRKAWAVTAGYASARGHLLRPLRIRLEKNLPVATGIGSGSADAAATLRALFRLNGLMPSREESIDLARKLGADVPVCFFQQSCRMQGAGERLTPLLNFQPLHAVLVNPRIAVPTAAGFHALGLKPGDNCRAPIADADDPANWRNDLTAAALTLAPSIADVLAALESQDGLRLARMSGSGATCFGLFSDATAASRAAASLAASHPHWWTRPARLG
jgi:4-diphosphocytidyl-2-C-methyl-D-erythritol kinase